MQFFKAAKLWIVLLAILSVAAFVFSASFTPRVTLSTALISPAMNFAYVRVEGHVLDYPTIDPDSGYLGFDLRDAGGDLRVAAYRSTALNLIHTGRVPMPGDAVTVEGTLRVRDEQPSLVLNDSAALSLIPAQARRIDASALDALRIGERITTTAQVRRSRNISSGLGLITLRADDAQFDLLLPLGLPGVFGVPPVLVPGEWIELTGSVGEFRGRRQLLSRAASEIKRMPIAREFDVRPITALNSELVGRWVAVRGEVSNPRTQRAPARISLVDGRGASLDVVMFDAWQSVPFSATLKAGDVLAAQGILTENRGQLELRPELAFDLALR